MKIMLLDVGDIPKLSELADRWKPKTISSIGPTANKHAFLSGLSSVVQSVTGDILALVEGDLIAGILCLTYGNVAYSSESTAREMYFYILPEYRGKWSLKIRKTAEQLARQRGCRHIIFTVSAKASADAERINRFFEHSGYAPFERSYIRSL